MVMLTPPSFNLLHPAEAADAVLWVDAAIKNDGDLYPDIIQHVIEQSAGGASDASCTAFAEASVQLGMPGFAEFVHDMMLFTWVDKDPAEYQDMLSGLRCKAASKPFIIEGAGMFDVAVKKLVAEIGWPAYDTAIKEGGGLGFIKQYGAYKYYVLKAGLGDKVLVKAWLIGHGGFLSAAPKPISDWFKSEYMKYMAAEAYPLSSAQEKTAGAAA